VTGTFAPNGAPSDAAGRRARQRLALAGVLALIVVAALFTPELIGGRTGDPRLTTYSASPQGARLLYDLTRRLGWSSERWTAASLPPADAHTVIAVLYPAQPLGAIESHEVMERVRAGSGLLYVISGHAPLDDSLHVRRIDNGGIYQPTQAGTADAPASVATTDSRRARRFGSSVTDSAADADDAAEATAECGASGANGALPMWMDERVSLWGMRFAPSRPLGAVIFARTMPQFRTHDTSSTVSAVAAAGFPLGLGRVVVLSDPDFLRNDVLRVCKWGLDVVAVRVLEYLARGTTPRDRLIFDEYHQGFGTHPGTLRAIAAYLSRSPSGHVLLQSMIAGLVLLLGLGPRLLPAHDPERVERRSPLEHVSALAHAYARVGGTRTATMQLLRGVRRRVQRGLPNDAGGSPEARDLNFLDAIEATPGLASDAALIRRALAEPLTGRDFTAVGAALARVEHTFLTTLR